MAVFPLQFVIVLLATPLASAENRKIENEVLLTKEKLSPFKNDANKKTVNWQKDEFNWDKKKLSTAFESWRVQGSRSVVHESFQSSEKTTEYRHHPPWMSSEAMETRFGNSPISEVRVSVDKISNISSFSPSLHDYTTVSQYATFHSPMLSRPSHLLGPLHGPDWILDKAKLTRKKPLDASTGIEGTLLWAVGLFGTVQNGAIVVTGIFSPRFRQPLHILICILAAADFFVSFIYIPTYTYFLLEGAQPAGALGGGGINSGGSGDVSSTSSTFWSFCNILRMMFIEIASVTLTIKVLISLYLYVLTYSKKVTQVIFSYRNTCFFILLAWISNFGLLFVPTFLGLESIDFYPNAMICIPEVAFPLSSSSPSPPTDDRVLMAYTLLTLSLHIVELLVISLCFSKVLRAIQLGCNIWGPQRKQPPTKNKNKKQVGKKDKEEGQNDGNIKCDLHYHRAKRITVLFFITFALCWLPIYLVNLVDPRHTRLPTMLHHFAMDMLLLKSAVNPAIYVYGIRALRREMKGVCMCRCDRKGQGQQTYRTSMDSCPSQCNSTKTAQMV